MILALVAPRHVLLATAHSDGEGDHTFSDERNIIATSAVYRLLGAADNLRIKFRPGRHHGFINVASYVDWFDAAAGALPSGVTTNDLFPASSLMHNFSWSEWQASQQSATTPPVPPTTVPLADRVAWLLGSSSSNDGAGAYAAGATGGRLHGSAYCESGAVGSEWDYKAKLMMHDSFRRCYGEKCRYNVTRTSLSFGGYITASLFLPDGIQEAGTPLPLVIFLHGYSYQLGFTGIYGLLGSDAGDGGGVINAIAARGVAVLAWDQTGMGARQSEGGATFYRRSGGRGSRLGAMVAEIQSALEFV